MASINLAGVLRNPDTTLASGGEVRLIHRSNTGEVVAGFRETLNVNNDGTYDFNIQYGNVFIQTRDVGVNQWTDHGTLTINQDTSATTLPELLNAAVPPTDAQLLEFQILLSDAEAAADRAEAAGERSIKVYPTLADIQADSELEAGKVVTNFQAKLDYYVSENQEAGGVPITGTSPQLYANPQQTTPGTGETNTASNIGVGEGTFAQKVSSDLQFYSQVNQYGLESRLIDDTYYRGLNPFTADNIGAFIGDMATSRATPTTVVNNMRIITDVPIDNPAYGLNGLGCYTAFINAFPYSEDFTQWSLSGVLTPSLDGTIGPIKANQAQKVTPTTSNSTHSVISSVSSLSPNQVCTVYYILKDGGYSSATIRVRSGSNGFGAIVDLLTGALSPIGNFGDGSYTKGTVEKLYNGFLLVSLTGIPSTSGSDAVTSDCRVKESSSGSEIFAGDGVSGIYIAAAQISQSDYVTPYRKTSGVPLSTGSTITTLQALGNLPANGDDFCFVIDCALPTVKYATIITTQGSESEGFFYLRRWTGNDVSFVFYDGNQASTATFDADDGGHRFTVKYESNIISAFVDGVKVAQVENLVDVSKIYSHDSFIKLGVNLNSSIKIKKWYINDVPTDAQILEFGGPSNVIL